MKYLMTTIMALLGISLIASAQSSLPNPGGGCSIKFNYDKAGNRVKRYYDCTDPIGPSDPGAIGDPFIQKREIKVSNTDSSDLATIRVYPNPVTDRFTVAFSSSVENCTVRLHNAGGQLVYEWQMENTQKVFDIESLASGFYQLTITTAGKNFVFKLIKQ